MKKKSASKSKKLKAKKPKSELVHVSISRSAVEALDRLCEARHVAPSRNRRAQAVMALILDALVRLELSQQAIVAKEQAAKLAREKRQKALLSKLN